ncbi:hypothetical protein BB559_000515 [Furculomyces boomerangus]|uniref:U6 snRNA phosphodiesterase 1 n=1 Tax=Furculomyces boomerangus TaxID=61424 RepID=A0A2T9Z505_9FUNG|nr:hypothetical protein BB559_000515 [Furculomyces boomerangus]
MLLVADYDSSSDSSSQEYTQEQNSNLEVAKPFQQTNIKGNWPLHIHIKIIPNRQTVKFIEDVCRISESFFVKKNVKADLVKILSKDLPTDHLEYLFPLGNDTPLGKSDSTDKEIEYLHISLSRHASLKFHQIEKFIQKLELELKSVSPFGIGIGSVLGLINESKSKSFLALKVLTGNQNLLRLLERIDVLMKTFSLPPFHTVPLFHASFLWSEGSCLVDPDLIKTISDNSTTINNTLDHFNIKSVFVHIGNKYFELHLGS